MSQAAQNGGAPLGNRYATEDEQARFERFATWLLTRGRQASTVKSYRSDWQALALFCRRATGSRFDASALDASLVQRFQEHALGRGQSGATLNRRLAFLRTYSGWLTGDGLMDEVSLDQVKGQARSSRLVGAPRVLDTEEVHRLLAHVDSRGCRRDQAIIYILLDSGLRVGELVGLDVGDVDFGAGQLRLSGARSRMIPLPTRAARKLAWSLGERGLLELPADGELKLPASGGWPPSDRVHPVRAEDLPALRQVPSSPMPFDFDGEPASWPLFVGEKGRLTPNAVQRVLRKHSAFARVDASPQVLRHTFAFAFWLRTHDLVTLAELLGHESTESAKIYGALERGEAEALDLEEGPVTEEDLTPSLPGRSTWRGSRAEYSQNA